MARLEFQVRGNDGDIDRACKHADGRSFEIGCRDYFGSAEPGNGKDGCVTTENLAYSSVRGTSVGTRPKSTRQQRSGSVEIAARIVSAERRGQDVCVALLNEILGWDFGSKEQFCSA